MTHLPCPTESWSRRALFALALALVGLASLAAPAFAFDLFAARQVTAQFATPEGKPMAHAEVRVFAPGDLQNPVETGRTDEQGKFVFDATRDGFWTAEARGEGEVARVMIRVGGGSQAEKKLSPVLVLGLLSVLVVIAGWYRFARVRGGRKG
jgi:nickel transport protein